MNLSALLVAIFNSTLVQLKDSDSIQQNIEGIIFQFHISSIKSVTQRNGLRHFSSFQFHISSIKRRFERWLHQQRFEIFNSTLVQLKEIPYAELISAYSRFSIPH